MRTAAVILNWNTKEYLRRFLPGLVESCTGLGLDAAGRPLAGVMVADSASTDGSLEMLKEEFPGVRTIPLDDNYGFTGGYNRAIKAIAEAPDAPEYIVLINSDIDVDRNWLLPLVEWMDFHPDCGACGPKLHALLSEGGAYVRSDRFEYAGAAGGFIDRYGFPYCRGRVMKRTALDRGQYDSPADVLWVSGACLVTRTALWKELGGLDDRFFAHMEEIDYCWRLALKGYRINVVPQSTVWHLGGGTLPQDSPWKLQLNFRNNLLLLDNNLAATFVGRGLTREQAERKAARTIRFRKILDSGASLLYMLSGRKDYSDAVRKAHEEFAVMKRKAHQASTGSHKVAGYRNICIILQSALRKERVFDHLDSIYENRH